MSVASFLHKFVDSHLGGHQELHDEIDRKDENPPAETDAKEAE